MADTKKRNPKPIIKHILPKAPAADCYVAVPDDKPIAGADWKPDGKFKASMVFDDETPLADLRKAVIELAKEEFGSNFDEETFQFPWRNYESDAKRERFRDKTVVTAKTTIKPKVVDTKRQPVPEKIKVFGGDVIRMAVTLYPYSKTEKVKEGKKMVDETFYGCSLRLEQVMLVEKNGGSGEVDWGDEEDGYVAPEGDDTAGGDSASSDSDF